MRLPLTTLSAILWKRAQIEQTLALLKACYFEQDSAMAGARRLGITSNKVLPAVLHVR